MRTEIETLNTMESVASGFKDPQSLNQSAWVFNQAPGDRSSNASKRGAMKTKMAKASIANQSRKTTTGFN